MSWGIVLAVLLALGGFALYIAVKVLAHLVSEEVEGRIDQFGYALVRLACLRLPSTLREEYYQWWQADLAEIFQKEKERPITRLCWALRFSIPLLFTGPTTARILNPEGFTASRRWLRFRRKAAKSEPNRAMLASVTGGGLTSLLVPLAEYLGWPNAALAIVIVSAAVATAYAWSGGWWRRFREGRQ